MCLRGPIPNCSLAWTNTVWDLKVWLWLLVACTFLSEICFVNSWGLIPSAVKSLAIWQLFSLSVYFACYRESLKVVFHKTLWSSILCASDTLPMKSWKPYGCWDDRGGVREVLLIQLDSVEVLPYNGGCREAKTFGVGSRSLISLVLKLSGNCMRLNK